MSSVNDFDRFSHLVAKKIMAREDVYQFSSGNKVKVREHYIGIVEKVDEQNVHIFNEKNPKGYQHYTLSLTDFNKWVDEGLYRIVTPRGLRKFSLATQIQSASTRAAESQVTSPVKAKDLEPEI